MNCCILTTSGYSHLLLKNLQLNLRTTAITAITSYLEEAPLSTSTPSNNNKCSIPEVDATGLRGNTRT
jgi:hypothetical protein